MEHKLTALLPMKDNSERVPNKNIRAFLDKPLFHQILEKLEACRYLQQIIINTDSKRIMELARSFSKVLLVQRPAHLCGGEVPMNDIIAHDINIASTEHILQTHSTNPLLTLATLEKAIGQYFSEIKNHDSLFSVTPWQTRFYFKDGTPVNHSPLELLRTQDLPCLYEENSCIYIFSKESFVAAGNRRIGKTPSMFPMSRIEAVDIDYEDDFILAEALAAIQK